MIGGLEVERPRKGVHLQLNLGCDLDQASTKESSLHMTGGDCGDLARETLGAPRVLGDRFVGFDPEVAGCYLDEHETSAAISFDPKNSIMAKHALSKGPVVQV